MDGLGLERSQPPLPHDGHKFARSNYQKKPHHMAHRPEPPFPLRWLEPKRSPPDPTYNCRATPPSRTARWLTFTLLYLTLLHAAGKPRDKFSALDNGLRDIEQSGLVNELLA